MNDKITKNDIRRSFKNMRELMRVADKTLTERGKKEIESDWFLGELEELANELVAEANVLAQYVIDEKFNALDN